MSRYCQSCKETKITDEQTEYPYCGNPTTEWGDLADRAYDDYKDREREEE